MSQILNRLEEVCRNIEEIKRRSGRDYDSLYIDVTNLAYEEYSLRSADITGKSDFMMLVSLLPPLRKSNYSEEATKLSIITAFFRSYTGYQKLDLTDDELYEFLSVWKENDGGRSFQWSLEKMCNVVVKRIQQQGLNDKLKKTLLLFYTPESDYMFSEGRKVNEIISYTLQAPSPVPIDRNDEWGESVVKFIEDAPTEIKDPWIALINHLNSISSKSAPPKQWQKKTLPLVEAIPGSSFTDKLQEWLLFNGNLIQSIHKNEKNVFLRDVNHDLFKSLIWCSGLVTDSSLIAALDGYASIAYKKKPGFGPISAKTGTACMLAFSMQPFKQAVTRLMKFRNKTTNNTILKSIDKIIQELAAANGYSKELVEEIGVMDFDLNENGEKKLIFDNTACTIKVTGVSDVQAIWEKDGKVIKSVPAQIKAAYAGPLKALKNEIAELAAQLQVQKNRIESYYLKKKKWNISAWKENYIDHPFIRTVASRLIWRFEDGEQQSEGILFEGRWVNEQGQTLPEFSESTEVYLWHPIDATPGDIVSWRQFMQDREITQPFKQAYREIYLLTGAEVNTDTYSNRFAAHILRQHQFAALCKNRGWSYHLMGGWDSHNTPTIILPEWQMSAQFLVDSNAGDDMNDASIFLYISTDQVRFYDAGGLMQLIDVPKLVFSEIMRDVDLFVGVTSIGNDPQWMDSGGERHNTYWQHYSFGDLSESAKTRSEVLQTLVPRLKIRDRCTFDGKFLVVKGRLRTYKIHMGSGNILMTPDDQYLCIVPESRKVEDKLYLPFEGDRTLSIILSKAMLLVDDHKITDETITRQIARTV